MYPCAADVDFMPENFLHGWCDFHGMSPTAESCQSAGCHSWDDPHSPTGSGCHCEDEAGCSMTGGTYQGRTCNDEMAEYTDMRHALSAAKETGTCEGVTMPWEEKLEDALHWLAEKCCSTFPLTACGGDREGGGSGAECDTCPGGCIVEGMCYTHDPEGNRATEPLCQQYFGVFCPDGDPDPEYQDEYPDEYPDETVRPSSLVADKDGVLKVG
jgi:hypothetical protein